MPRRRLNIAVTALNAIDSPGPGIPVIRALRESKSFDVRIIGLAYEVLEPGIYMHNLVDKTYQIPLPSAGTQELFERLRYIHKIEKLDVIIPNFDSELYNFIKFEDKLRKEFNIRMYLPGPEQFEERQKANLAKFGTKYGIKVPKSKTLNVGREINSLPAEFNYPLLVKGKYYEATVVYSAPEALMAFNRIAAKWGLPIIVQEFIRGVELNVTVLGNGEGETMGAVPMRKQYITDKGKAWSGISINDKKLLQIAGKLVRDTKWRGSMELEMIKTEKDEYYLLEINPRFPAWIYLAAACGQNHPEALVQLALGEKVSPFENYESGKLFVRYSQDLIVDLKEFETISTKGEL